MKKPKAPEIRFKVSSGKEVVFNKKKPETLWVKFEVCKDRQGLVCINNPLVFRPDSFWKDWEGWFIEPVDYDKLRAAQPDCIYTEKEIYLMLRKIELEARAEGIAQGKKEMLKRLENIAKEHIKSGENKAVSARGVLNWIAEQRKEAQKQSEVKP